MTTIPSLAEIEAMGDDNRHKAIICLEVLDNLMADDLARPDYRIAATVYAQLHMASMLERWMGVER